MLGNSECSKADALNIPSVKGCIKFIADIVTMLPIKLYKNEDGKAVEIKNDIRVKILNNETGDTLNAEQFWRAIIADYFLGKGGYAYINKQGNKYMSLHYVDETYISVNKNTDPIFKNYNICVNGKLYEPHEFIKILRNTKDGAKGHSIIEESPLILSVAINTLKFEDNLVKKGGNKKGFLKSTKKLTQEVIDMLKVAWQRLYCNNSENVVVLNDGLEFQESSNTSVEMQLNENKETNSTELYKLFTMPASVINGTGTNADYTKAFKMAALPVIKTIECALNRDYLLEKEKESFYYAFDTKEMLKGDIKERYDAYKTALESNFMQIDEVRFMENLPALGLNWIKLGLDSVLYDPTTNEIYTANTNMKTNLKKVKGGEEVEN
ncbi:phage portal protein [Aminipila terrae]|uniref:phage portal protein n=1 Tax=Aminipila terrae TaxID=2697030 RepID=UPI00192F68A6|nr:phage portal protein [Aminipila terrae]